MLPITLENGATFLVEVPVVTGRQDVSGGGLQDVESLGKAINGVSPSPARSAIAGGP